MRKWMLRIGLLLTLLNVQTAHSQDIPVGAWRTHFSYNQAHLLEASDSKIFCATTNGFFTVDRSDMSINKISKIQGLGDVGISAMKYDPESNVLVLGYGSGLIDVISETEVFTVRDFTNLNEQVDKKIFDLEIYEGTIYAASNIGILAIPISEKAILENYRSIGAEAVDLPTFEVTESGGKLYVITTEGIQYGDISSNLLDFNNWNRIDEEDHSFQQLTSLSNQVYFVQSDSILSSVQGDSLVAEFSNGRTIRKIRDVQGALHLLQENGVFEFGTAGLTTKKTFATAEVPQDFLFANSWWIADGELGLLNEEETGIKPNGPLADTIKNLSIIDDQMYALYGPKAKNYNGAYDSLGYDLFENGQWSHQTIDDFYNITDAVSFNNKLYFSSAGMGIYNASDNEVLSASNSILKPAISGTDIIISDMAAGRSLWATSYNNNYPLVELTRDDDWNEYHASLVGTTLPDFVKVSDLNVLWVGMNEGGISVLYPPEERQRTITQSAGLPPAPVRDIALTVDDEAWVATSSGVVNFEEGSFIFDEGVAGIELTYEGEEVYNSIPVTAVATDGGGRIWVAGLDHLAIYNRNLTEREFLFTAENSPLPSGSILQMEYNELNGEMFILTAKGLISYRSNSSKQNSVHTNVSIFPNPVRPNYTGQVGIKGVVSDAEIKITDINGKLIQKVRANGGTASWNLRDYNNARVRSGVFLVFSASGDGEETYVGKIAVLSP